MKDRVKIEIHGGVPYIIECPKDTELHVYDFDVDGVDEENLCTCEDVDEPHIHHESLKGDEIND